MRAVEVGVDFIELFFGSGAAHVRAINDAGMKQRDDIRKLNETLQADLSAKGLQFNKASPDSFRAKLREAGFYAEWKGRFGNEAWGLLEQSVGKLA
jgi:TRAP-type C4-dicarboxylate transport system substrate-binding protein